VNDFETVRSHLVGSTIAREALARIEAESEKRLADVRKMDDLRMAEIRELKAEVERLRDEVRWHKSVVEVLNEDIERLRKRLEVGQQLAGDYSREVERLQTAEVQAAHDARELEAEVERLRADHEQADKAYRTQALLASKLKAEVERLRAALEEVAMVSVLASTPGFALRRLRELDPQIRAALAKEEA
jgi:chromosome segregation ATPase